MYFFTDLLLLSNARLFLPATLILHATNDAIIFILKRTHNNVEMYITWNMAQKRIEPVWLVTENVLEIFLSLSLDRRYLGLAPNKSYIKRTGYSADSISSRG